MGGRAELIKPRARSRQEGPLLLRYPRLPPKRHSRERQKTPGFGNTGVLSVGHRPRKNSPIFYETRAHASPMGFAIPEVPTSSR